MPAGDYKTQLPATITVLDQTTINDIVAQAQAAVGSNNIGITIGIPAGLTLDAKGIDPETGDDTGLYIPDGVSVTFFGLSGGDTPVLNFVKSLNIKGGRNYIRFENINFTDGGCQYLINQSAEATISEDLSFKQCRFDNFERSLLRTQGSVDITIANINVDDCVLTNMSSSNGYSVFYFGTAQTNIGRLSITNTTVDTSQRSFIEASKAPITNGVFISDCTFYNNVADGRYFMDAKGQATDLVMKNTILGKSFVETARGARTESTISIENCLRASDCIYSANDIKELEASDIKSSEIFADPDNHDFTLKINQRLGDPRWFPAE